MHGCLSWLLLAQIMFHVHSLHSSLPWFGPPAGLDPILVHDVVAPVAP